MIIEFLVQVRSLNQFKLLKNKRNFNKNKVNWKVLVAQVHMLAKEQQQVQKTSSKNMIK